MTRVTAPSAPSPTTRPSKSGSPREAVTSSPAEVTSSRPATAVARLPLASPEPWVAVATAPATEMWGSDARLCRARPSCVERLGELAVRQPRGEGDRARRAVDDDVGGQRRRATQLRGVGDVAERVPRAEHPHPRRRGHDLPHLLQRRRPMQPLGAIRVVASPVDLGHATNTLTDDRLRSSTRNLTSRRNDRPTTRPAARLRRFGLRPAQNRKRRRHLAARLGHYRLERKAATSRA